ncbi:hypothetical protein Kpol_1013p36 [Vanderwaltozyma polyspora DSM 70294]|uniref:HDA1 complex subunit 3 n=1 Tax=Vanderwaltozyma polyspora (strain ATCC 22028 / DSM 70294 / BCRC 21397 / CBS 2163 / NBRC 10782 / NRRL Y-8283 / UCD 57-17) TaxID=436907 RepID=A7TH83_VANPO|nr:uncharacterized protein Kpol_1013p36 [Vanderwaltozyma polyspora DSM 70294]EDO18364.1 hypothetical protein Kpol_1013p36 [Vanderwaltozyma polyspora DSM 70294]
MDLLKILDTKPVPGIVDAKTLDISGNTSGDYWLPTTMCLYQKELTDQIVSLHYSDILRYFETNDYKEDVVLQSLETMCLNSQYVATHPYLLIDHHMPKSLVKKDLPMHLTETSGKFAALRDLVNILQEYENNIAIICRKGRTMDLLEALLLGNKVNIKRYDGNLIKSKQKPRKCSSSFHLFPSTDLQFRKFPIQINDEFDIVIALDPSVDSTDQDIQYILKYRRDKNTSNRKAPLIRMIAINSIDHCDLYFNKKYKNGSKEQLEYKTAAVVVLRDRVGILPPDLRPIYSQKLNYLVEWIENPTLPWPLPDVFAIKEYTPMDVEKSLLTEVNYSNTEDYLEAAFTTNRKRGRAPEDRDANKECNIPSFYDVKRVQNDYSTNPLKQNMTQLTGITTANGLDSIDYHLSSGILTHKLIQSINEVYKGIQRQYDEIKDYKDVQSIQLNHENYLKDEQSKMKTKYEDANSKKDSNISTSTVLDTEGTEIHNRIDTLDKKNEADLKTLEEKGESYKNLKEIYLKQKELKDNLEKEERLKISRDSEKEYMQKEISRAENAIQECNDEISKIDIEMAELSTNLEDKFTSYREKTEKVQEKISNLKKSINNEENDLINLKEKLRKTLMNLNNLPTPRIRVSNGNNNGNESSSRRYKNRT